jgi:uncharacterized protein YecE (DUF72 family)
MVFDRKKLKREANDLAAKGVFVGTSSWKYRGWCGMLYDEQRYMYRGKFAETRFEKNCLSEYAEVFKTVCVDAGYYRFPDARYIEGLISQVPSDFRFTFKVTDEISLKKFANLPRFGLRAGKPNENFLNADLFTRAFIQPFEPHKANIGMFIFEFSKFYRTEYEHGRDFLADLDKFLSNIPKGWNYGVEIRNKSFLQPEYFALLARHDVAHVFNSWSDMPPLHEQIALEGSHTSVEFAGARVLLKSGRKYQEAVDLFSPYNEIKDAYPEARQAAAELIGRILLKQSSRRLFMYINNRLEGNALQTIAAILELLAQNVNNL